MKSSKISAYLASTIVLIVAIGFYAYSHMLLFGFHNERYPISAQFYSANTLEPGADVILSGVPVGIIRSIHLNKKTFMADVLMEIDNNIKLPVDSVFSVGSVSMTDNSSIMIKPGHSKEFLKPKSFVVDTRPYLSIEQQISNYIFGSGNLSAN